MRAEELSCTKWSFIYKIYSVVNLQICSSMVASNRDE